MRDRLEMITQCLHVANASPHVQDQTSLSYDKLHKVRWMLDEIFYRFKTMWSPNQQLIVNKGMIMYKGYIVPSANTCHENHCDSV
jgi:hypothetical protein